MTEQKSDKTLADLKSEFPNISMGTTPEGDIYLRYRDSGEPLYHIATGITLDSCGTEDEWYAVLDVIVLEVMREHAAASAASAAATA